MANPKPSMAKAKKKALALLRDKRTWRQIAEEDYGNQIHYSVLCKFALKKGEYIPGDVNTQKLLGLITERSPYAIMPRWWARTPEALDAFANTRGKAKKLADDTREEQYKHRRKP
jgi:hypothetical protein